MAQIIGKSELAILLKGAGFKNVTIEHPGSYNGKTFKNWNDESFKGFKGGSVGPMTMTNAHIRRDEEILQMVVNLLRPYCVKRINDTFFVQTGEKTFRKLSFNWSMFPTHSRACNYDDAYQTNWLTLKATDVKTIE